MALLNKREKQNYISILQSDGTFRQKVTPETPGAVLREFETKTKDGETVQGSKHELVWTELEGHIVDIGFIDGDFGKQLRVKFTDGVDEVIWAQDVQSNFAEDFMKKLPNVQLEYPVKIVPFAFTDDRKKERRGVSLYQGELKITDFFYDPQSKTKVHGFPEPEGEVEHFDSDDWKMYFMKARKFLINYTANNVIPKLGEVERVAGAPAVEVGESEVEEKPRKAKKSKVDYPENTEDDGIPF